VNRTNRPTYRRWAVILLSAGVLALAGCGRKGGLDLPPNASGQPAGTVQGDTETEREAQPSVFNPNYGTDAGPKAAKGKKGPFILDPLLNSN
jgi:predicted small lipoprotein YifL